MFPSDRRWKMKKLKKGKNHKYMETETEKLNAHTFKKETQNQTHRDTKGKGAKGSKR